MVSYDSRPVSWIVGKGTPKIDKDNLIKDKVTKVKAKNNEIIENRISELKGK